ncbi:ras guanine nucleotide exchange factor domain-containing protein [Podospora fimiseda]|uniref:Ras guanine nucleotide exchange factor domain-containing protein n=1 Tax=Podospora fimiseda TaxID=252190 RepID=A0AAN7GWG2_9PEZI|nr:ras guanine nucleotide exchange factor domain-containing protein [Podospora fimiseda]
MAMLNSQTMRSSLQVAPLAIQKTREYSASVADSDIYSQTQITPPATPNGSQENLHVQPPQVVEPPPTFHNFLRAFYPFQPEYVLQDSTVTLPLNEGDVVLVHSIHTNGWADGTLLVDGTRGWLPTNYCEAYDPEEMKSLLKALLNFWDLMRTTSGNDCEMFGNQEFMKGIIAGVRYLLEQTHCLTRESPLVQRHEGLRRSRKSLLSELSSLVKTAKRLQDAQRIADIDEVNEVVDEMILRAFKIITKGVRFMDILDDDRRSQIPEPPLLRALADENNVPPTPPAESSEFDASHAPAANAGSRTEASGAAAEAAPSTVSNVARDQTPAPNRLSSLFAQGSTNANRLSQSGPLQVNRLSSTVSHRLSSVGLSPITSRPQNLVSARLNACHDTFLSHLGSFIGRLHFQAQSRLSLALAVKQSAISGGDLLVVVDIVCTHNSAVIEALEQSRAAMYDRIQDLVYTARDILANPGPDEDELIVPQDNGRLLGAATGCVKASGECAAKTKWVIERIGDFEFEFDNGSLGVDFDLSGLDWTLDDKEKYSVAESSVSVAESVVSETPTASTTISVTSSVVTYPPVHLSIDKPLPQVPQGDEDQVSNPLLARGRAQSLPTVNHASAKASSVASTRADLPPLPRISTSSLPADNYSPTGRSAMHDGEFRSFRSESMTASSSGSASTYLSRDSETSLVSHSSTRATTPDITPVHNDAPSISEVCAIESSAPTEEVEDVESKLLAKTYAHELIFKEGQVIGGSLAALVERLTTHESTPDAMFVSTFYLTFRLFCTPVALAEALIDRFDYVGEAPLIANPVRLRTYNVFKGWLESYWREDTDHDALSLIKEFAEVKLTAILPSSGKRLFELAEKVSVSDGTLVPRFVSSMNKTNTTAGAHYIPADTPLPSPVITRGQTNALTNWKAGGTSPSIIDFDPLEIARQLTIKQMSLFCSIMPEELLGTKWTKLGGAGAPNVKAMSAFTTGLSNLVADSILAFEEVKKRALVIKHWIKIANQCSILHNYDALMAITCALTDTSIKRLKITWDSVSVKRKEMLKSLQATVDFNQNYKVLRARLHDRVPPCLPFLGMFLTDLTFVDVGNPATKTSDTGLTVINFDKHTRTAKSIGELQRFQIPYRLTELPDFQEWLNAQIERVREKDKAGANTQASHYRKSLLLEPREVQNLRAPIEAPQTAVGGGSGMFGWMRGNSTTSHGLSAPV